MNRRDLLRYTVGAGLSAVSLPILARQQLIIPRYRIGACDWSIGPAGSIDAFTVAKQIGLDGVQVSLNTKADQEHLRNPAKRQAYIDAARTAGVGFSGLAIGLLNEIPYKSDPRTDEWVSDSIDVAQALGVKNVLLAFFSENDLRNDKIGQQTVIDKLKAVAPKAERAGVVLGIESWLSAPEHVAIIDAVGSSAVKVYYDVCNSTVRGYDIFREMRDLGKDRICEVHIKENGHLLGQGQVDLNNVHQTLNDIGYKGWLQIEGAIPSGQAILPSYIQNNKTVRQIFV